MKIDGACHCGDITYEAELDPNRVGICHCTDCQTLSASAFRTIAAVEGPSFKILTGTPREYVKTGDSGNRRVQAFCPNCGTGLYATNADGARPTYNVRVGTVRQRAQLAPRYEAWHGSAQPWFPDLPDTKKFTKSPA